MKMLLPKFRYHSETWVELPKSKYGIEYILAGGMPPAGKGKKNGVVRFLKSGSKKACRVSPFEEMLQELNKVTLRDGHITGTALMYLREIFEPGDASFDHIGDYVCASQLSKEQVDRLRIIVLPWRREAKLLSYLHQIGSSGSEQRSIFGDGFTALGDFGTFHRHYLSLHNPKEKFDELFGFSFAVKHHSEWIFQYENQRQRETMIKSLAKHWRNLMQRHSPEKLGLDTEFSYPALMHFLNKFKTLCDSIETFGSPPLSFIFNTVGKAKMVTFSADEEEDSISSLTHTSSFSSQMTDKARPSERFAT